MTTIEFITECRWCDKKGGDCEECIDFHCRSCDGCGENKDKDGNLFCYDDLKETEDQEYYCKDCIGDLRGCDWCCDGVKFEYDTLTIFIYNSLYYVYVCQDCKSSAMESKVCKLCELSEEDKDKILCKGFHSNCQCINCNKYGFFNFKK